MKVTCVECKTETAGHKTHSFLSGTKKKEFCGQCHKVLFSSDPQQKFARDKMRAKYPRVFA